MTTPVLTLDDLRHYAVARTLFKPTTLARAIEQLAFVQADPIRAPARAQDLVLRHRVRNYRAGDLERRYARLAIEEDFFINYGFLPRATQQLMHPRSRYAKPWSARKRERAQSILAFLQQKGALHPRRIEKHFAHGRVTNYWGGSSNATTHLLDDMHYRSLLRVVRRTAGIRVYAAHAYPERSGGRTESQAAVDQLVDVLVQTYAPLPRRSLDPLIRRLRYGVPQWRADLPAAIARSRTRLNHAKVDGVDWVWPAGEDPLAFRATNDPNVRLLSPFDPIVWDRLRFEIFWGWAYRFEAYTPPAKRKLGYYALPLLWRDRVIGWGNVRVEGRRLVTNFGYVAGRPPADAEYRQALRDELQRILVFLSLR